MSDVYGSGILAHRRQQAAKRPTTPHHDHRRLFQGEYSERPQSSIGVRPDMYYESLRPPTAAGDVQSIEVPPSRTGMLPASSDGRLPPPMTSHGPQSPHTLEDILDAFTLTDDRHEAKKLLKRLHSVLKKRKKLAVHERESIQHALGRFFDVDEPKLLVNATKIIFQYQLSSSAIGQSLRALFKLSRDKQNDAYINSATLFNLVFAILDKKMSDHRRPLGEDCVYGAAFLKNAATNKKYKQILEVDPIDRLSSILRALVDRDGPESDNRRLQVAIQLFGAVRQVLGYPVPDLETKFLPYVTFFSNVVNLWRTERELVWLWSRTISKVSLSPAFLPETSVLSQLCDLLFNFSADRQIILRLSFALGNLTAFSDDHRSMFVFEVPASVSRFTGMLGHASDQLIDDPTDENVELFAKLIRVVANLAINPDAGILLSQIPPLGQLPDCFRSLMLAESTSLKEEALLNASASVTNLTFYASTGVLAPLYPQLTRVFIDVLLSTDQTELIFEALRALGNLSRVADCREILTQTHNLEVLTILLSSQSPDVLAADLGVLLNLSADQQVLPDANATMQTLLPLLDIGEDDIAELACKNIFNLLLHYKSHLRESTLCQLDEVTLPDGDVADRVGQLLRR